MKFNWGTKIAAFYLVFVAGIMFLVWNAIHQKVELVTPDYYEKELKYQDQIDASHRAAALSEPVSITQDNSMIRIKFPREFLGKPIKGTVLLYCPSDEGSDTKLEIHAINNEMPLETQGRKKGLYQIQVQWDSGGPAYYFQKDLFIN